MIQKYLSSLRLLIIFVVLIKYSAGFDTIEIPNLASSITQAPVLTPFPTGIATSNDACSLLYAALSSCNSISPEFSTASYTDQRACLCQGSITTSAFTGAVFDSDVSMCADYAHTAVSSYYTELTNLEGFCASTFSTSSSLQTITSSTTTPPESSSASQSESTSNSPTLTPTESPPEPTPTPSSTPEPTLSPTGGTIQSFNSADIAGVSVGCGAAALLLGFGLYVGVRKKRGSADSDVSQEGILSQEVFMTKTQ